MKRCDICQAESRDKGKDLFLQCTQCHQYNHLYCMEYCEKWTWHSKAPICPTCQLQNSVPQEGKLNLPKAIQDILKHQKSLVTCSRVYNIPTTSLRWIIQWRRTLERVRETKGKRRPRTTPEAKHLITNLEKGKQRKAYDPAVLKWAVKYALRHRVGCRQAARAAEDEFKLPRHSIPHSTVNRHMKDPSLSKRSAGAPRKFSLFEENWIVQHLLVFQQKGEFLTPKQASQQVLKIVTSRQRQNPFANCKHQLPSAGFWRELRRRHPELKLVTERSKK